MGRITALYGLAHILVNAMNAKEKQQHLQGLTVKHQKGVIFLGGLTGFHPQCRRTEKHFRARLPLHSLLSELCYCQVCCGVFPSCANAM